MSNEQREITGVDRITAPETEITEAEAKRWYAQGYEDGRKAEWKRTHPDPPPFRVMWRLYVFMLLFPVAIANAAFEEWVLTGVSVGVAIIMLFWFTFGAARWQKHQ